MTVQVPDLSTFPSYTITTSSLAAPFTFQHSAFTISTSPVTHTLCGAVDYTATFDGTTIDAGTVPPAGYDSATRTLSVFYDQLDLVGLRSVAITGFLADHPTTTSPGSGSLTFLSPCEDVSLLTITG